MWLVRLALRRPYSFAVMALLMLVLGITAIVTMRKDIFPHIGIPVVSVVGAYSGMSPDEISQRIVTISERAMTTAVNDIEQVTALCQTILRPLPTGTFPPGIIAYDASSVPILQLGLHSDTLGEQQLYDFGQNTMEVIKGGPCSDEEPATFDAAVSGQPILQGEQ